MKHTILSLLSVLFCLTSSADETVKSDSSLQGQLTIVSTPMFQPLLSEVSQRITGENSGIRIKILKRKKNTTKLGDLLKKDNADLFVLEEKPTLIPEGFKIARIAVKSICFIVNDSNKVDSISKMDIIAIFNGTINNWKSLKSGNTDIHFACPPSGSDEWMITKELIFPPTFKKTPEKSYQIIKTRTDMIRFVERSTNALGVVNCLQDTSSVKVLMFDNQQATESSILSGQYPLRKDFYLVSRNTLNAVAAHFLEELFDKKYSDIFLMNGFLLVYHRGDKKGVNEK